MSISSFDELLTAARSQAQPQRLLFVFASAGIPDDASAEQRARFVAGKGGTLTPLMCVDKRPDEVASFDMLLAESRDIGAAWDIVFVAAMAGAAGVAPTSVQAAAPLQAMVDAIKTGRIGNYLPFDGQGLPVRFG